MQSHLCVNSEPYIVVKGSITVTDPNDANYKKKLALKNNAPFIGCLSKINNVLIDNAEDLDVVTPMLNLIEYIKIIQRRQDVFGVITETNQIVV